MSTLRVDTITDEAGTGPVSFPNGVTGVEPFKYTAVSGAAQALDVGSYNFFDAGTLTADTTVSFSNVPTEARWTYTANSGIGAGFDLSAAGYTGESYDYSAVAQDASGVFFKSDGTKMFIFSAVDDSIFQFSLSTAWDVSTASYDSVSFSVASQDTIPQGMWLTEDGTRMYMYGGATNYAYQYSLSTAWDLSTASYTGISKNLGAGQAIVLKSDGTVMYRLNNFREIEQYPLSTAWNISTAGSYNATINVGTEDSSPRGFFFSDDGAKLYMVGYSTDTVYEYLLSTPWNVGTDSNSASFSVSSQATLPFTIAFKPDGRYMYISDLSSERILTYITASGYSITLPNSVSNPPTTNVGSAAQASYTFFTADGGTTVKLINEEVL